MTASPINDDSDFDITETIAVLPSTGTKGGRPITTEVYYYYADDGAFISVADGNQGLVDLKGPEAVQLAMHLLAAGRRAIELEEQARTTEPSTDQIKVGVMDPDRLDALIGKVVDIEREQDAN